MSLREPGRFYMKLPLDYRFYDGPSYVWAPYIPVVKFDEEHVAFTDRSKLLTRYSDKIVNKDFYATFVLDDVVRGLPSAPIDPAIIADPKVFPHECPKCRAPAYIGFMKVDCSRKGCI